MASGLTVNQLIKFMGSSSLSGPTNRCLDFRGRKINKPIDDLVRLNLVERGPAKPV